MEHSTITCIPKLPNDLIIEIITRLPVKPLLRFTCVCKSWLSLISSKHFIRTHLSNKRPADLMDHRIMLNCHGDLKQCALASLFDKPVIDALDTFYSDLHSRTCSWVVGSCDGLVCVTTGGGELILWNPSTRKSKNLPDFGEEVNFGSYFTYGFGFDKSSDDYKVVVIFNSNRILSDAIVKVYSLKTRQWKKIKNFEGRWLMDDPAAFANGKLYWIANPKPESKSGWSIVSLDLETEVYKMLQMPDYVETGFYLRLGACEGRLYLFCSHETRADVWTLDDADNGVGQESWSKVVSIPYIDDFLRYTYKKVLYVLKNGEVLLVCGSKLVVFDSKDCSFRYPEIRNSDKGIAASTYVESLVSPLG